MGLTKTVARVILTFECDRGCDYCCNEYASVMSSAEPLRRFSDLWHYRAVCLTGGEPMIFIPYSTIDWARRLKLELNVRQVYVYISAYRELKHIEKLLKYADGITYTLHEQSGAADEHAFLAFQEMTVKYPNKTFRALIHPRFHHLVGGTYPCHWNRLGWLPPQMGPETCALPDSEDLFYLEGVCPCPKRA